MQAKVSQYEPRKREAKADEADVGSRNAYSFCNRLSDEDELDDETDDERETKHQEDLTQDDSDSGSVSDAMSFHSEEPKSKEILDREDEEERVKAYKDAQFKYVVQQLLVKEGIKEETNHGEGDWSRIIISLASEATNYIKPDMNIEEGMDPRDMNCGEGMDPGGYVKVKSVASGQPSESRIVKGIVCGRNVAHKRMKTRLIEPKILIFGCALESIHKHVSSLKVVKKEETHTLTLVLTRMDAFHPNLLLVEKTVSRQAQDWILKKDISLVLNVKRHLLERIAKCTDATIIPSHDHLTSNRPIKVGQCQLFHVERYMKQQSRAGEDSRKVSKALMFFEGCPKPLVCTISICNSFSYHVCMANIVFVEDMCVPCVSLKRTNFMLVVYHMSLSNLLQSCKRMLFTKA